MPESRAVIGVKNRLAETVAELSVIEPRYRRLVANRQALAKKLVAAGLSEREVGKFAGVSGPRVHQWKVR